MRFVPVCLGCHPLAENCRAYAHHGGALRYGGLQITAHAHGQSVYFDAEAVNFLPEVRQNMKIPSLDGLVLTLRRQAHQTSQAKSGQGAYLFGLFDHLVAWGAGLVIRIAHIDLYADIQWRQGLGALLIESLGDLDSVHCMNPLKLFSYWPCFIALNPADEVPG